MWIVEHIPVAVFHIAILASIAVIVITDLIPFKWLAGGQLQLAKYACIFVLALSIWCEGVASEEAKWNEVMDQQAIKVAQIEKQSVEKNVQLQNEFNDKIKVIEGKSNEQIKLLKNKYAKDLDSKCKLTIDAVELLRAAAAGEISRTTTGTPSGSTDVKGNLGTTENINKGGTTTGSGESDVKASIVFEDVLQNYETYYKTREQVLLFQKWYDEQKKLFESIK